MLVRLMASIRDLFLMIPKPNIPFIEEEMKHSQIKPVSPQEAVQMLTIGRDEILSLYNSAIRNIQACLTELASKSSNPMRTPPSYGPVYPHEIPGPIHLPPPQMAPPPMESPQMVYPMPPPPPPPPHLHQTQGPPPHYVRPYENGHQMAHQHTLYQQMPYNMNPDLGPPYSNSGWNGPAPGPHLVYPDRYGSGGSGSALHHHHPGPHPVPPPPPPPPPGHLPQHYGHLHGSMQTVVGPDHPGYSSKWDNRVQMTSPNQTMPQQQQQQPLPPPPVHRHYIPH